MKVGIICSGKDNNRLKTLILSKNPDLDVQIWPDIESPEDIEVLILWKQPPNVLSKFNNLKFISSFGAGIDHILFDSGFERKIPVTKVIDPGLNEGLFKYCLTAITFFEKKLDKVIADNLNKKWDPNLGISRNVQIGILGLGEIGQYIAVKLRKLNYSVSGYSNSPKTIQGIKSFQKGELNNFLSNTNVLICTLPLTDETVDYLNKDIFDQLNPESLLIQIGRGKQLVEDDLLMAIENNKISLAFIDVFRIEPLPDDHPFWENKQIIVSPHIASLTNYEVAADQFVENVKRFKNNEELKGIVNLEKGY